MTLPAILCIGAAHWDVIGRAPGSLARGDDVPGRVASRPGGVALNIAAALAAEGRRPGLLAAIGADSDGEALVAACSARGIDTGLMHRRAGTRTGAYLAIEDARGLVAAIAHAVPPDPAALAAALSDLPPDSVLVLDGTLPEGAAERMAGLRRIARTDLRLAAVSPAMAFRFKPFLGLSRVTLYLNRAEAAALAGRSFGDAATAARALRAAGAARVLVTDGAAEAAWADAAGLVLRRPPAVVATGVTGAGDVAVAAHIAAELRGADAPAALEAALAAAARHVGRREPA